MTAGTSADVLIAAPASGVIYDLDLQVASEAGLVAIRDDGMLPSLHTKGSWTYQAGVEVSGKRKLLSGPIRIIADREGVDVTARFRTTFNDNPNAEAAALAHLDRYTGSLSGDQSTAIKAFYKSIYNAGVFQLGGWLSVLIAPNAADALMDWMSADGDPLTTSGSPTFTAFDGYDFNGSSQYLDSGQLLGSIGAIDDHTLLVDTGTTIQAANACAIGDGTTRIQPNRSTTAARFNSGSATGDVVEGFTPGGLVGLTRRSTAIYEVFHNESFTDNVTRTPGSLSTSLNVLVGAGNSGGGVNNFFAGDIRLAAVLTQMTRSQEITFATAWATFKTAMGI